MKIKFETITNENGYIESMNELANSVPQGDRTGVGTTKIFNQEFHFDIEGGNLPILIGKNTGIKLALVELIWIMSGKNDLKWLKDNGVHYWDKWVKADGTFGPIYGTQMRNFGELGTTDQLNNLIESLSNNFNSRRHIISLWDPTTLKKQALPPCFTPNKHYVKIKNGYKLIENVNIGDFVLGDDSKYHKVYDKMKTKYKGINVKIKHKLNKYGIESTQNHPFLVRNKGYVAAGDLKVGDWLGITSEVNDKYTSEISIEYKNKNNETKTEFFNKPEEWYFMGYYLGNGHRGKNEESRKYFISIPNKKQKEILDKINKIVPISIINNSGINVKKFQGANYRWWNLLKKFGDGAKNKKIPDFIINSKPELIEKFLEGYKDADGCETEYYNMSATTISPQIAYGIQALYSKLNKSCNIGFNKKDPTTQILGRTVNQNDVFAIRQHKNNKNSIESGVIHENNITWVSINELEMVKYDGYVYNLSVEDNHTYTVNNIINHNCHFLYHITTYVDDRGFKNFNLHVTQRSGDSFLGVPYDLLMFMYFMKIIEITVNVNFFYNNEHEKIIHPSQLFLTVNDYHLYSNHHEPLDIYNGEFIHNRKIGYKPPKFINFSFSFVKNLLSIRNNKKVEISDVLKLIIDSNFDIFKFKDIDGIDWVKPKMKNISADVAV